MREGNQLHLKVGQSVRHYIFGNGNLQDKINSFETIYFPKTRTEGIVTPFVGGKLPIYKQPEIPVLDGTGKVMPVLSSVLKRGVKKGAGKLKARAGKALTKAKGQATARARAVANKKVSALKRKVESSWKQKVTQIVKKRTGKTKELMKINKQIGALMKNPPGTIMKQIKQELSREIRKVTPKKTSIKGGPSHNELVRRAERLIYSDPNF